MTLTDEDISKFQAIYQGEFGVEISQKDAYEQGIKLLRLMSLVYQPMTEKEYSEVETHRKNTINLLTQKITPHESKQN